MLRSLVALAAALFLVPVFIVVTLRFVPPPVTAFMLQSEVKPVYYQWAPSDRIAPAAAKAVVAAEDQKFWSHSGFDFEAMAEAHARNKQRSRKRGASTISQQTAKNLFLWPGGGYFRKGIEAWLTVLIEALWPKTRILEVYLNIVEFGPGIYGVEAAAQKFFGKPAAKLSVGEAARLAASLPRPSHWHAASGSGYAAQRAGWILGQMGYRPRGQPAPVEPQPPEEDEEIEEEEEQGEAPAQNALGEGPEPGVLGSAPAAPAFGEAAPSTAPEPGASAPASEQDLTTYPLPREGGQVVDEPVVTESEEEDAEEDAEEDE